MEVPRDDRQIKAAEASRRTGVVEDTVQEEGAATLHHAVEVNPKQHRACLLYSSRLKHKGGDVKLAACDDQPHQRPWSSPRLSLSPQPLDGIRLLISYLCRSS